MKTINKFIRMIFLMFALALFLSGCASSSNAQSVFGVPLSTWNKLSESQQRAIIRGYYYGRAPKKKDQQLMNLENQ